jgi:hypothetical protein
MTKLCVGGEEQGRQQIPSLRCGMTTKKAGNDKQKPGDLS